MTHYSNRFFALIFLTAFFSCSDPEENIVTTEWEKTLATFGDRLPVSPTYDYQDQDIPSYITKDNTTNNPVTNEGATLGRVLFYDKNLSVDKSVACATCHQQDMAFSDSDIQSNGMNGLTGRHSMRLINTRFSEEAQFFWDERAETLEDQTTKPIQDHNEMGFSGENDDPGFADLVERLEAIDYYQELFTWTYGDAAITEERMQQAIAQFVRSIQSFDSKYDAGRAQVNQDNDDFPNYSTLENRGKRLFLSPPPNEGAGCGGCHRAPEFDIDPNTRNNGIIGVAGSTNETDPTNTKAPSLRDLFNSQGELNGPLMHNGSFSSLEEAIAHYSNISQNIIGIDRRLNGQQLNLSDDDIEALVAFVKTLSGTDVYTNAKWSTPFAE